MRKKLLIFPFNGNGREALDCLTDEFELIGFIDDEKHKQGKTKNGIKVFSREALTRYKEAFVLAVPGSPTSYLLRDVQIKSLKIPSSRFARVIHPKTTISPSAKIGHNVLIMSGVVITRDVKIGNHVCILPNSVIQHDSRIDDFVLIGSQVVVAGYSRVSKKCYIGSASSIINNIIIGKNTLVGMGANVISAVASNKKVVGNPAKEV